MGVPQFFHWLVTHYSKELLSDEYPGDSPPDYLYLDFNCGIHPAVKREGLETLEQLYQAVCDYLDNILKQIRPRKTLYIAIDGVAPMGKMKQQRIRRFKSVQDRNELDKIDRKHGCYQPAKFDFNMISPGTEFMINLTATLRNHIDTNLKRKYPNLKVILDDASNPGEGEHKIMYHLRTQTRENDSVVVYGLDSDLIFLCMLHYRPNFNLFREKIFFGQKPKSNTRRRSADDQMIDEEEELKSKFTYLNLTNFRQIILSIMTPGLSKLALDDWGILNPYKDRLHQDVNLTPIEADQLVSFSIPVISAGDSSSNKSSSSLTGSSASIGEGSSSPPKNKAARFTSKEDRLRELDLKMYQKNLELDPEAEHRLILDYTAICFLLGNDFLPHIPSLKIKEGGLNRVIECYKEVQGEGEEDYLTDPKTLSYSLPFLKRLLQRIAQYEDPDLIKQTEASQVRRSKFRNSYRVQKAAPYDRDKLQWEYIEDKYTDILQLGQANWKSRYYQYYLGSLESKEQMADNYLAGLSWVLRYYLGDLTSGKNKQRTMVESCPDWEWKYYFRAAPPVSDLLDRLVEIEDQQQIGKFIRHQPVTPDVQLMLILPPKSNHLLNPKLQKLMTDVDSPVSFQYPIDFQIDLQDHRFRWECYPILPPVNLKLTQLAVEVLLGRPSIKTAEESKLVETVKTKSEPIELKTKTVAKPIVFKKKLCLKIKKTN